MEGREPCPYRIVDDVGGAFCMGAIGGGVWNYFKGLRNAPKGERLRGGIYAVKARSPVVGGQYAPAQLVRRMMRCSPAAGKTACWALQMRMLVWTFRSLRCLGSMLCQF